MQRRQHHICLYAAGGGHHPSPLPSHSASSTCGTPSVLMWDRTRWRRTASGPRQLQHKHTRRKWDASDHIEERCLCFTNINWLDGLLQATPVGGQTAGGAESAAVGCSFSVCRLSPAANRRKNNDCGTAASLKRFLQPHFCLTGSLVVLCDRAPLVTPRRRPALNVSESISVALTNRVAPALP